MFRKMSSFDQIGWCGGNLTFIQCASKQMEALRESHSRDAELSRQQFRLKVVEIFSEKKQSEQVQRTVFYLIGIMVLLGIVVTILYRVCGCERKNREKLKRHNVGNCQPIGFTDLELVNEHQIQTLNRNPRYTHRNTTTTEQVNGPPSSTLDDDRSTLLIPTRNNKQLPADLPPPSYEDCILNVPAMQTI